MQICRFTSEHPGWLFTVHCQTSKNKSYPTQSTNNNIHLVGGFNPFEKYKSKWESSPNMGENKTYLKPPTSHLGGWFPPPEFLRVFRSSLLDACWQFPSWSNGHKKKQKKTEDTWTLTEWMLFGLAVKNCKIGSQTGEKGAQCGASFLAGFFTRKPC